MRNTIKQEVMMFLLDKKTNVRKKTFKKKELASYLNIQEDEKEAFHIALKELKKEGIIDITTKKQRITLTSDNFIVGTFYFNPKGYGFVVSLHDKKNAYFVTKENIRQALHEDIVIASILKKEDSFHPQKPEVVIRSVVEHHIQTVIGTYIENEHFGFVVPDNHRFNMDIYIPKGQALDANSYDKVVCQITEYPDRNRNPEGKIIEVLGLRFERGVDLLSVIKGYNLRDEFPMSVIKQVEKMTSEISEDEWKKRKDLRNECIFTIDGEDTKDLDDAVSIKRLEDGYYELGVHIADVSHFVKENSKVDKEALERGTSVYLIDTVLPMLPFKLSNDLCSLNPNTDRLTLSVLMKINPDGEVVEHQIFESVISSKAKLHYKEVTEFLEGRNASFALKYPDLVESLQSMKELALILMKKREKRGTIDFDFPEAKIQLSADGEVTDVSKYERGIANQIIEEFMIICNETVAETFLKKQLPFVYRIHENPKEEKIQDFNRFIERYGYELEDTEEVEPKELQMILKQVKGKKEEKAFHLMLLQSMQQARYSPICKGHFGLATKYYCHFTSPIRRYPDLQIHRIIKEYLHGQITEKRKEQLEEAVQLTAKLSSKKERIAQRAEEELYEMKKMEFMRNKIGKIYEGNITSIMASGFMVTLDNTVTGFVGIRSIQEDDYEFIREEQSFISKKTGERISLGDTVMISVEKVKPELKEIMFKLHKRVIP